MIGGVVVRAVEGRRPPGARPRGPTTTRPGRRAARAPRSQFGEALGLVEQLRAGCAGRPGPPGAPGRPPAAPGRRRAGRPGPGGGAASRAASTGPTSPRSPIDHSAWTSPSSTMLTPGRRAARAATSSATSHWTTRPRAWPGPGCAGPEDAAHDPRRRDRVGDRGRPARQGLAGQPAAGRHRRAERSLRLADGDPAIAPAARRASGRDGSCPSPGCPPAPR